MPFSGRRLAWLGPRRRNANAPRASAPRRSPRWARAQTIETVLGAPRQRPPVADGRRHVRPSPRDRITACLNTVDTLPTCTETLHDRASNTADGTRLAGPLRHRDITPDDEPAQDPARGASRANRAVAERPSRSPTASSNGTGSITHGRAPAGPRRSTAAASSKGSSAPAASSG